MENTQLIYKQLSKNINRIKIDLQNQIKIEKQSLQQECHNLYETKISYQHQQIDSLTSRTQEALDNLQEKLETIKKEVDALQIEVMQPKIWYKDASVIISLLAVVFSLGTAMASYFQVDSQNKRAARVELRELLQRLIALPKENAENLNAYKNERVILSNLSSNIHQEYILLANQAVELANRIPKDISAPEYLSIAQALVNESITDPVPTLLDAGLKVSKDINSELALLRTYGQYFFLTGEINKGRQKYQEAMSIFSKYLVDKYYIESSNAFTEVRWANSEYAQGECKQAENLLKSANSRITKLPQGDWTDNLKGEMAFTQNYMKNNSQRCNP